MLAVSAALAHTSCRTVNEIQSLEAAARAALEGNQKRVRVFTHEGAAYVVKRPAAKPRRLIQTLFLRWAVKRITGTALPTSTLALSGATSSMDYEAGRLKRLAAEGVRVPRLALLAPEFFVLEHCGADCRVAPGELAARNLAPRTAAPGRRTRRVPPRRPLAWRRADQERHVAGWRQLPHRLRGGFRRVPAAAGDAGRRPRPLPQLHFAERPDRRKRSAPLAAATDRPLFRRQPRSGNQGRHPSRLAADEAACRHRPPVQALVEQGNPPRADPGRRLPREIPRTARQAL